MELVPLKRSEAKAIKISKLKWFFCKFDILLECLLPYLHAIIYQGVGFWSLIKQLSFYQPWLYWGLIFMEIYPGSISHSKISQNPQENTCARASFLIKRLQAFFRPATSLKKRIWHRCFPVKFVKIQAVNISGAIKNMW